VLVLCPKNNKKKAARCSSQSPLNRSTWTQLHNQLLKKNHYPHQKKIQERSGRRTWATSVRSSCARRHRRGKVRGGCRHHGEVRGARRRQEEGETRWGGESIRPPLSVQWAKKYPDLARFFRVSFSPIVYYRCHFLLTDTYNIIIKVSIFFKKGFSLQLALILVPFFLFQPAKVEKTL
jgi:hypothetical protein